MELHELNKQQTVLLAMFVSFVTSIATGIVTVSLLEEAPVSVDRTINKVVQRTVERVVPSDTNQTGVVEKEKTVIVREEDQIADVISNGSDSMVRIYTNTQEHEGGMFVGIGIITSDNIVVADASTLDSESTLYAQTNDGNTYTLDNTHTVENAPLGVARIPSDAKVNSISIGDVSALQLGQTVIALSGQERNSVSVGIISEIIETENDDNATTTDARTESVSEIVTSISMPVSRGTPLLNMFGEVVAVAVVRGERTYFITANHIERFLNSVTFDEAGESES